MTVTTGMTVSSEKAPVEKLAVGLKVDSDVLPASLVNDLKANRVDLNDPAVTLALLDLGAVVGVKGFSNGAGGLQRVGITCALCHSTVDNSFTTGIGHRLDGWANQDLNVGAIVALAPNMQPVADQLLESDQNGSSILHFRFSKLRDRGCSHRLRRKSEPMRRRIISPSRST